MELRVGNRYRLGRKIGSGSFGDIYLGETETNLLMRNKELNKTNFKANVNTPVINVTQLLKPFNRWRESPLHVTLFLENLKICGFKRCPQDI